MISGRIDIPDPDEVRAIRQTDVRRRKERRSVYLKATDGALEFFVRVPDVPALVEGLQGADAWREDG